MPIYEYTCRSCGRFFEALVRHDTVPACPDCQGQDLERALSLFGVDSAGTRKANLERARREHRVAQQARAADERASRDHHDH